MLERPVRRDKRVESVTGGSGEQGSILDARPAHESDGEHIVPRHEQPEVNGHAFIEQEFHAAGFVTLRPASSSTAMACSRVTDGNCRRNSSSGYPPVR